MDSPEHFQFASAYWYVSFICFGASSPKELFLWMLFVLRTFSMEKHTFLTLS